MCPTIFIFREREREGETLAKDRFTCIREIIPRSIDPFVAVAAVGTSCDVTYKGRVQASFSWVLISADND